MTMENRERAKEPEDLSRFFLERANAGDVEGVVALYETHAVLANPPGRVTVGIEAIRGVYEQLLATRPAFIGDVLPATRVGDLALTSAQFATTAAGPGGSITVRAASAEVARRQLDGTWLWMIDQPNVVPRDRT